MLLVSTNLNTLSSRLDYPSIWTPPEYDTLISGLLLKVFLFSPSSHQEVVTKPDKSERFHYCETHIPAAGSNSFLALTGSRNY